MTKPIALDNAAGADDSKASDNEAGADEELRALDDAMAKVRYLQCPKIPSKKFWKNHRDGPPEIALKSNLRADKTRGKRLSLRK